MLLFLHFSGSNQSYIQIGWAFKVSEGVVSESVHFTRKVFYQHLVQKYLKLPTLEEAQKEAKLFAKAPPTSEEKFDFPKKIYLSLDGTHIPSEYNFFIHKSPGYLSLTIFSSLKKVMK